MFRRFLLVGLMVLAQGSVMQVIIGALFAAVFLLLQVQARPFESLFDDVLASAASFCLVVVFLCAIAFKYLALTQLTDIQVHACLHVSLCGCALHASHT